MRDPDPGWRDRRPAPRQSGRTDQSGFRRTRQRGAERVGSKHDLGQSPISPVKAPARRCLEHVTDAVQVFRDFRYRTLDSLSRRRRSSAGPSIIRSAPIRARLGLFRRQLR
jgi:hypothetical protein